MRQHSAYLLHGKATVGMRNELVVRPEAVQCSSAVRTLVLSRACTSCAGSLAQRQHWLQNKQGGHHISLCCQARS